MSDTLVIISIIAGIISILMPFITVAFVIGVMKSKMNGIGERLKEACESVKYVHHRIDEHIEKHHTSVFKVGKK